MKKYILKTTAIFLIFLTSGSAIAYNHPTTGNNTTTSPDQKRLAAETRSAINNFITGSSPLSTVYSSIQLLSKLVAKMRNRRLGRSSLADMMEDWDVSLSASYNTFNATSLGNGYFRDYSVTLSKSFGEDLYGGFNIFEGKFSIGGAHINSKTIGITGFINKDLNENWSVAGFIILGTTDTERKNGNGSLYGGGLIGSYHRPLNEAVIFSNTTTLSKIYSDTGHDTIISNMTSLDYQHNEEVTISPYLTLTDSLRDVNNGDTTYWSLGCDFQYQLKNSNFLTLGYERTFALKDLHDNRITLSYDIAF